MPLKLSRANLGEVRCAMAEGADPQSLELIDLLLRPFGAFFDYNDPRSLAGLRRICEAEGLGVPGPEER